jgi:CrcB protein
MKEIRMLNIIAVASGGALGALARHYCVKALSITGTMPTGVLAVNLIGCLMLGIFVELLALKIQVSEYVRLFITVGLLGAFTTFSTFILDVLLLNNQNNLKILATYLLSSVLGGIICMLLGIYSVKLFIKLF